MKTSLLRYFYLCIPVIAMAGMFFSCSSNDLKDIEAVSTNEDSPNDVSFNVEMTYTDSGKIKAKLESDEIQRFVGAETVLICPRGIHVTFYDSAMREESHMYAMKGKFFEGKRRVELRDSVVVQNDGGAQLNTEYLVWVQDSGFYTDKYVKITKDKTILYGHGLTANENFTEYTILKPSGQLEVATEETEEPVINND
jgi:LPS export ABC transporter protein LptC